MKYYYRAIDNVIKYLGSSKRVPKTCTECSKAGYDKYIEIINSIEDRVGYETVLTLYTDFTYTVEYIPVAEEE